MGDKSKIEWTEATWNPWHGCHKVSAGCKNCYMFRDKKRYGQDPNVVVRSKTKFYDPLKWSEPRTIFTCSWSDFFIEEADAWRDEAFAIMALTPQHTYQVLTKRPEQMAEYISREDQMAIAKACARLSEKFNLPNANVDWPLPNVWLGVSIEDQATADERIPILLETEAAIRWLSVEPLLGPINLTQRPMVDGVWWNALTGREYLSDGREVVYTPDFQGQDNKIDWVIVGGESGKHARPMHPDWARSLRDQCVADGVPFFFKQWGEWLPFEETGQPPFYRDCGSGVEYDSHGMNFLENGFEPGSFLGAKWMDPHEAIMFNREYGADDASYLRIGKKAAGRELDGRTWDEMPEVDR